MSSIETGWLRYASLEVVNHHRTLAYLPAIGGGLTVTGEECCHCDAIDEGPFTTPENDDAPWWEPTRPESGDFYGLLVTRMELTGGQDRDVTQRAGGGASIGPPILRGRTLTVEAVMWAGNLAAMRWGELWLSETLSCGCGGCGLGDICVLPACPPEDSSICEDDYFRVIPDAGLVGGGLVLGAPIANRGVARSVAFQLTSRQGWLLGEPILAAEGAFSTGS